MVLDQCTASRLADVAVALADASALEDVCVALESGRLHRGSAAATFAAVAAGHATVERCLQALGEAWDRAGAALSSEMIILVLRTSAESLARFQSEMPRTEAVWTGPNVDGSFLRATREVVREILRSARQELLVVGYWIAARDEGEGIIEEAIASLADAARRQVAVTVILDERVRPDGRDNRRILLSVWPSHVPLPTILTWRLPKDDDHLKLHAKVLVADRRDALVTSANLTSYAMDRNMEMGVRLVGRPAREIVTHFDLLASFGVLEPYDGDGDRG